MNIRTTIVRLLIAAIFAAAAWVSWSESQLSARVATARQAIATFDYDATNALTSGRSVSDYIPGNRRLADDISIAKSQVAYWLGRYDAVAADTQGRADADVLLAAANASFRSAQQDPAVGPAAVQRLDGVLQAYAAAMKASPRSGDALGSVALAKEAAYNYEFVARTRDQVAKGGKSARIASTPVGVMGGDLPAGPTIHGAPGAPPPDAKTEEFQTIMPMEYGDREAQPEATPGVKRERKG
jgi:hypothetical protein